MMVVMVVVEGSRLCQPAIQGWWEAEPSGAYSAHCRIYFALVSASQPNVYLFLAAKRAWYWTKP